MDINKMLKDLGADKPKQTRPNDAKWQNNAIQWRSKTHPDRWSFLCDSPIEYDFIEGRRMVEHFTQTMTDKEFRLVAILEVS